MMREKTINEQRTKQLYAEAVAWARDTRDRDTVLSQLYMLVKRELALLDWPTTNQQDPYGYAIFEMVSKYGSPSFNPYEIWRELNQGGNEAQQLSFKSREPERD